MLHTKLVPAGQLRKSWLTGATVLLLLVGAAFVACDNGGDGDDENPVNTVVKHLIGGKIGSGTDLKSFFADKSSTSSNSRAAARAAANVSDLEGKIEDGGFAITLKGTYDETSGKFLLGAMSDTLGIGYSIEGFIKPEGPKDVKAVVKAKSGTTWTETEVAVQFDDEAQVSAAQEDAGVPGLPAAWTGLYPLTATDKTNLEQTIDAMFFGIEEGSSTPLGSGLGEKLADSFFYAVGPWDLSLQADFTGIDAGIDSFLQERQLTMDADEKAEKKKDIHMLLSQMVSSFYFSFLEVTTVDANTRDVVAFMLVTSGGSDAVPDTPVQIAEKKYFTKMRMSYTTNTLTLILVNGLSVHETEEVQMYGYDEYGNIIPLSDDSGNPVMTVCEFENEGVAATAEEARNATDFTVTVNPDGTSNKTDISR
jgi:hypothetical protein